MKEGIIFEIAGANVIIMTKKGEFVSVPAHSEWKTGEIVNISEIEVMSGKNQQKYKSKNNSLWRNKSIWVAMIATLLILMIPLSFTSQASSFVTLDINPSLELELRDGKVINIRPLNEDAKRLLSSIPSENINEDLYDVTTKIMVQAKNLGYLKINEENIVMIGILDDNNTIEKSKYEQHIQNSLSENKLEAEVMILDASKAEKKLADKKGVSLGKYLLQKHEEDDDIFINDNELIKEDINEIFDKIRTMKEIKSKKLPKEDKLKADDRTDKDKFKDKDNDQDKENDKDKDIEKDKEDKDRNNNKSDEITKENKKDYNEEKDKDQKNKEREEKQRKRPKN